MGRHFGNWLRGRRKELTSRGPDRYTQDFVATSIGAQASFISAIESGRKSLPREKIVLLAECLEIPSLLVEREWSIDRVLAVLEPGDLAAVDIRSVLMVVLGQLRTKKRRQGDADGPKFTPPDLTPDEVTLPEAKPEADLAAAIKKWMDKSTPPPDTSTVLLIAAILEEQPCLFDVAASAILSARGLSNESVSVLADIVGATARAMQDSPHVPKRRRDDVSRS